MEKIVEEMPQELMVEEKPQAVSDVQLKMQERQCSPPPPAMVESSGLPRMESVSRISKLPIIESAWGVASVLYGKVKYSNSVVSWTLTHAEVAGTAALVPVASRLETPLQAVDNILCKGIDIVEEKVPAIKMPPRQMLDSTREYVVSGLRLNDSGPNAPAAAKIIGAGVGVATAGLRTVVSAVEWTVDKYMPPQQGEEEGEEKSVVPTKEASAGAQGDAKDALLRLQKVTRRVQRRLIRIATAQIKSLKQQKDDATSYVGGVAQYITTAVRDPKSLVSKAGAAWVEMARQLQSEEGEQNKRYPNVIVRRLARRVVGALDGARETIVTIPGGLSARFNSISEYGIAIIGGILNTSSANEPREPTNGQSSEERAKLLCMRQEKGTSPPPAVQPAKAVVTTADKESSTEEKPRATTVPSNDTIGASIAVAN